MASPRARLLILLTLLLTLTIVTQAHFLLTYPPARGFDENNLVQYPCGGQNTVSAQRTPIPIDSPFPVQLDMHHTASNVQVVLALGNDPSGNDFTHVVRPTFPEDGPRDFCVGGVVVRASLAGGGNGTMLRQGMNATLLVVTNGDGGGGLYNCADITLTSTPLSSQDYTSHCSNSTGVHALDTTAIAGKNANETTEGEASSSSSSGSTSSSSSGSNGSSGGATKSAAVRSMGGGGGGGGIGGVMAVAMLVWLGVVVLRTGRVVSMREWLV